MAGDREETTKPWLGERTSDGSFGLNVTSSRAIVAMASEKDPALWIKFYGDMEDYGLVIIVAKEVLHAKAVAYLPVTRTSCLWIHPIAASPARRDWLPHC
jgi:hypothetical protein